VALAQAQLAAPPQDGGKSAQYWRKTAYSPRPASFVSQV
jgi:hypothetical protein